MKLENMKSAEGSKYDKYVIGFVAKNKVEGGMDFKEVERNFEVKEQSLIKPMMVDADVNEKLFGTKKPSKEDKKCCKRRRETKNN